MITSMKSTHESFPFKHIAPLTTSNTATKKNRQCLLPKKALPLNRFNPNLTRAISIHARYYTRCHVSVTNTWFVDLVRAVACRVAFNCQRLIRLSSGIRVGFPPTHKITDLVKSWSGFDGIIYIIYWPYWPDCLSRFLSLYLAARIAVLLWRITCFFQWNYKSYFWRRCTWRWLRIEVLKFKILISQY